MVTGKEVLTKKNRFFTAFLKKSRTGCVKMGLAHEKKSYLQEKNNLFEIGSICKLLSVPSSIIKALIYSWLACFFLSWVNILWTDLKNGKKK